MTVALAEVPFGSVFTAQVSEFSCWDFSGTEVSRWPGKGSMILRSQPPPADVGRAVAVSRTLPPAQVQAPKKLTGQYLEAEV